MSTVASDPDRTPASGITQAVYPVSQDLKRTLLLHLLKSGLIEQALVFTRTKHRTNRLTEFLVRDGFTGADQRSGFGDVVVIER